MSRADELDEVLKSMVASSAGIEAAALISEDGLMIAGDLDDLRIAGMSTSLRSFSEHASRELQRGDVEQIVIRGSNGYLTMLKTSGSAMLLVLTDHDAKLGLLFVDMRNAVAAIAKHLGAVS